jgi:S-formylglutathione hydrolase
VPWGEQAFTAYLGPDREAWRAWDACELIRDARERLPLLVDQGEADEFLATELQPELLRRACDEARHPLTLRMQPGYDHSYYFIATFIGEHVAFHARALRG